MKTYNDIFLEVRKRLREAGVSAFDLEARLIMSRVTGKTREEFISYSRLYATDDTVKPAALEMVRRRISGEPIAYIVGEWEFYSLPILVNEFVLIPRVDTEVLAEEAIALLRELGANARMLDLCAGSGCIGLAAAKNVPRCRVVLADNSEHALRACRANMLHNGLTHNVTALEANAMKPPPALLGRFDLIVSNPPYIPTEDIKALDVSVRDYEPAYALDGGSDGLEFYRAIVTKWTPILNDGGYLAFECGIGQAREICGIMSQGGYVDIRTRTDTLGIERVAIGKIR